MELSPAEVRHLGKLRRESPFLVLPNARVAALGGRMIPARDGSPAPEPSSPRAWRPSPRPPAERGG